jgi:hypothetical protein
VNTGQTILTIGALVLLSLTVLLTNRASFQYGSIIRATEVDIYGVSLAESIIEEAAGKAFDHYSAADTAGNGAVITDTSQLTLPRLLGKESDDNYWAHSGFDDIDDYNSWNTTPFTWDTLGSPDVYHIQAHVFYVDFPNPDVELGRRSWHKKIVLKVWPTIVPWGDANAKPDTITLSYIQSYWWFR